MTLCLQHQPPKVGQIPGLISSDCFGAYEAWYLTDLSFSASDVQQRKHQKKKKRKRKRSEKTTNMMNTNYKDDDDDEEEGS